jgi:hypothetical protein
MTEIAIPRMQKTIAAGISAIGNKFISTGLLLFNLGNEPFTIEHLADDLAPDPDIVRGHLIR